MPKSDLPFGSEFSPSQIDLAEVLELADRHGADWKAFERAVRRRYFESHAGKSESNKDKLANNTKLGMRAYGLIEADDASLTELGRALFELRNDPPQLYERFARHILVNRHGMTLIQCIDDMRAGGEQVTGAQVRRALVDRGLWVPVNSRIHFTMRLWLEKAGIFAAGKFVVNYARLEEVLGTDVATFDAMSQLTREQRAYLHTLATLDAGQVHMSNDIAKLTEAAHGIDFQDQGIPKLILYPLQDAGFIALERGTKRVGRGAKPFRVLATEKTYNEVLPGLLEQIEAQIRPEIRPLLRKRLSDIREEVRSSDTHIRGLALEALAFKLMRLINLDYVATRLRGSQTGGAEVDLIFESARLVYNRWQIQCKNTRSVSLDDVAKEVGLTHMLKSNAIVMVTTGAVGREARRYATEVMRTSNICIMMIDGDDLSRIDANPTSLVDILTREATSAMQVKTLELDGSS